MNVVTATEGLSASTQSSVCLLLQSSKRSRFSRQMALTLTEQYRQHGLRDLDTPGLGPPRAPWESSCLWVSRALPQAQVLKEGEIYRVRGGWVRVVGGPAAPHIPADQSGPEAFSAVHSTACLCEERKGTWHCRLRGQTKDWDVAQKVSTEGAEESPAAPAGEWEPRTVPITNPSKWHTWIFPWGKEQKERTRKTTGVLHTGAVSPSGMGCIPSYLVISPVCWPHPSPTFRAGSWALPQPSLSGPKFKKKKKKTEK